MVDESVLFLTVTELAPRIRTGQLSPVELTQAYLERSRRIGPQLNAYVTLTEALALEQARQAEREIRAGHYRGPLHGIPYAAKDLLAVAGYPTTWGARPCAQQRFPYTSTAITRLEQAGAVLLGKAAMIELAGGLGYRYASASLTGAARNPWNRDYWTCGSSSGSGAVVAAALGAFALGSETWGSIVCPSAFCGVSGLRPTFGRVSRFGAMALAYSMDKIGPMARSAEDLALILEAIAGNDPRDPDSLPESQARFTAASVQIRLQRPLRIGWLEGLWDKPAAGVAEAAEQARRVLAEHGAIVEPARLPQGPWDEAANITVAVEATAAFRDLLESGQVAELADPLAHVNGYASLALGAADYLQAQRVRAELQQKMDALFDRYDVLAAATMPVPATRLEANLETDLTFPDPLGSVGNLCGLPAVSVPCGIIREGLPVGLEFLGRVLDDAAVLAAAVFFQQHTDWHRRHPPGLS